MANLAKLDWLKYNQNSLPHQQDALRQYFPLLDGLRALAALCVITAHTGPLFGFIFSKAYLAVDLFFVLSGFVVASAYERRLLDKMGPLEFAWVRIVRLFPLYILALFIAIGANFLSPSSEFPQSELWEVILLGLVLLPVLDPIIHNAFPLVGPSWSLFFELFANFVYAAFARRLSNSVLFYVMVLSAATLIAMAIFVPSHNFDLGWTRRTFVAGFPRVGYSFCAGVLLYRIANQLPQLTICRRHPIFISLSLMAIVAISLGLQPPGWLSLVWDCVATFCLFPTIIYVGMQVKFDGMPKRILAYLGTASYTVYVVHKPAFDVLQGGLTYFGKPDAAVNLSPWSGLLFAILLVAVSAPLDRFYDKPIRKRLGWAPRHRP